MFNKLSSQIIFAYYGENGKCSLEEIEYYLVNYQEGTYTKIPNIHSSLCRHLYISRAYDKDKFNCYIKDTKYIEFENL